MLRVLAGLALLLDCSFALAQSYVGTFTTTNSQGIAVTLILRYDGPKHVKGTLSGNDATFQVGGEVTPEGLMGAVTGPQGSVHLMAQYEGANLIVFLAEARRDGQPDMESARRLVFAKAGAPKPEATSATDAQLGQFLTRNAWCAFNTGGSERVVFYPNGMLSSSPAGRWKVANGMLYFSPDGNDWEARSIEISQTSSGHPIMKSGGKEYVICR